MKNLILLLTLALFAGCGGTNLTQVTGTVTIDGAPAVDAVVTFVSDSGGLTAAGSTDGSGKYTLACTEGAGTPPGSYSVKIKSREKPKDSNPMAGISPGSPEYAAAYQKMMAGGGNRTEYKTKPKGFIPEKYDSGSLLKATVGKGSHVADFKLESK